MKRLFQVLLVLGLAWFVACQSTPSSLESTQSGAQNTIQGESSPPASTIPEGSVQEQREGDLVVEIFSLPEVVVAVPAYPVKGKAPAGSVVSINEEIVVVGDEGNFEVPIPLEEGPNVIEVVASNQEGYQVEFVLVVTYEPES